LLKDLGGGDDHRLDGDILVIALVFRRNGGNGIDDFHSLDDRSEDRVTGLSALGIQSGVIGMVDEELGGGAIGIVGSGHGDGASEILETIGGLIGDWGPGGFLLEVGGKAAALDHETLNHAVEDRAVEETILDILDEVLNGDRGGLVVEGENDIASGGFQLNDPDAFRQAGDGGLWGGRGFGGFGGRFCGRGGGFFGCGRGGLGGRFGRRGSRVGGLGRFVGAATQADTQKD